MLNFQNLHMTDIFIHSLQVRMVPRILRHLSKCKLLMKCNINSYTITLYIVETSKKQNIPNTPCSCFSSAFLAKSTIYIHVNLTTIQVTEIRIYMKFFSLPSGLHIVKCRHKSYVDNSDISQKFHKYHKTHSYQ